MAGQDNYNYFDIDTIFDSLKFTKKDRVRGMKLAKSDSFEFELSAGYSRYYDNMICDVSWSGVDNNKAIKTRAVFDMNNLLNSSCNCPSCSKKAYYYWRDHEESDCEYMAGLLLRTKRFLIGNPVGDATTKKTDSVLRALSDKRITGIQARSAGEQAVSLEPYIKESEGNLELSFRIVECKALIIKDLIEFINHIDQAEEATYGTSMTISHKIDNFDERSRQWIGLIREILQEEESFRSRMQLIAEKNYMSLRETLCGSLSLYGWRLDRFYEVLGSDCIIYEETTTQDGRKKKIKHTLTCQEAVPSVSMIISPMMDEKNKSFHGINVTIGAPVFFKGTKHLYYIKDDKLCRTDKKRYEVLEPLLDHAESGLLNLKVGRSRLSEFYYSVLPQLGDIVQVIENDPDLIRSYLPADIRFCFYLDAADGDVTCRPSAIYDNDNTGTASTEVSMLDVLDNARGLPSWRMKSREEEILYALQSYFPVYDSDRHELSCDGDEDAVFKLLESGIAAMEELGEVQGTDRFRNMNVIRQTKVRVGVSVSGDLLDLTIATDDISPEELLEVLQSYKLKKKYYRLKSGSFLNMEDSNLKMLEELYNAMQITDKELMKQNIHLPIYRTLYLNRLLEDNESIYNSRDSVFRSMVRRFKTVQDADYEVPESLAGTLRGYQVNGYKWLRTLQSCGFGGILADEMGLGKTLQAIAVLLAKKLEGNDGTHAVSLVVSPASLVYNWCEEFSRFAPGLSVMPVTGTQSERRARLKDWQSYDVLVTSYDLLKRDIAEYEDKSFDTQIIDEAQYIKNHSTAASKAVKVVHAANRLALTGTPVENRLSELWSIFDFLMPGFLYRYETFRRALETPIVKNQDEDAMARLKRMTGPFILRRLKSDVLRDLPDKLEENRFFRMEGEQRKLYDAQVVRMKKNLAGQSEEDFHKQKLQILAELTRLRQICCDPSLCFEDYRGGSAKLEGCIELIESAVDAGHKILLFSQFVTMLEIIEKRLDSLKLEYYCITGATPKEKRLQMVKAFNTDKVPVFLVSLKAGGVGLNLTGADVVIHYDPWWNLAVQNQATDRAHRIGQTKKVTVYKLLATSSIEEKIQKLQESKKDLADQILSAGEGQLTSMSRDELLELLQG